MSIRPKWLCTSSKAAPTCLALDTSHATASASRPASLTAITVSCPASAERSKTATLAPSCASFMASAAPIPLAAPVTTATRPSSLPTRNHLSFRMRPCYIGTNRAFTFLNARNYIHVEPMCPMQITSPRALEQGVSAEAPLIVRDLDSPRLSKAQDGGLLPVRSRGGGRYGFDR